MVRHRIDCDIPAVHQLCQHLRGIEQHLAWLILIQTGCDLVQFSETVILVDDLIRQNLLDTHVAAVDIRDVLHLSGEEINLMALLFLHRMQPVAHIADHKSQNQQLRNPYVRVDVQHHIKTAPLIHLHYKIPRHRKYRRKCRLLLPVGNGKQQHIQKIKINILEIRTPRNPVI